MLDIFSRRVVWATALVVLGMAFVVLSALGFEYIGGYIPCELCLLERKPYYIGVVIGALGLVAALLKAPLPVLRIFLIVLFLLMLVSAGLGAYHAGVEWRFWEGPSACSATSGAGFTGGGNILDQLNTIHGPSCTDAALRILGISFAGWNVLASLALAALAFWGQRPKAN